MIKGAAILKTKGTFHSRDRIEQIEAEDMDAKVPEGWQLLSVRATA